MNLNGINPIILSLLRQCVFFYYQIGPNFRHETCILPNVDILEVAAAEIAYQIINPLMIDVRKDIIFVDVCKLHSGSR